MVTGYRALSLVLSHRQPVFSAGDYMDFGRRGAESAFMHFFAGHFLMLSVLVMLLQPNSIDWVLSKRHFFLVSGGWKVQDQVDVPSNERRELTFLLKMNSWSGYPLNSFIIFFCRIKDKILSVISLMDHFPVYFSIFPITVFCEHWNYGIKHLLSFSMLALYSSFIYTVILPQEHCVMSMRNDEGEMSGPLSLALSW